MREINFKPTGVCSTNITFQLDDENRIHNLVFTNGCNGNLKAIGKLVEGRPASEVSDIIRGNDCKGRGTSCADQLSKALDQALASI
ncbi:MAG: TIGR03905 family TSCPD domain-containing protein [Lachnospiraceae bacterium]|nr:TIGR03905 family TSCPD domain-containing protein [Lachnospiraceae bacterium]